jgi:hypothetical protein
MEGGGRGRRERELEGGREGERERESEGGGAREREREREREMWYFDKVSVHSKLVSKKKISVIKIIQIFIKKMIYHRKDRCVVQNSGIHQR